MVWGFGLWTVLQLGCASSIGMTVEESIEAAVARAPDDAVVFELSATGVAPDGSLHGRAATVSVVMRARTLAGDGLCRVTNLGSQGLQHSERPCPPHLRDGLSEDAAKRPSCALRDVLIQAHALKPGPDELAVTYRPVGTKGEWVLTGDLGYRIHVPDDCG